MGKKLAIRGHSTRGKEVIELLEMMGGENKLDYIGGITMFSYYVSGQVIYTDNTSIIEYDDFVIFTLEEFLEKFPYRVGDKVVYTKFGDNCDDYPVIIESMKWTGTTIEYTFNDCVTCLAKDLRMCNGETEEPDKAKAPKLKGEDYSGKRFGYKIPDGYEFDKIENGKIFLKPIKPTYPANYDECKAVLQLQDSKIQARCGYEWRLISYFQQLLMCRNAYWKIAGEQMGLGKPWEPDWNNDDETKFCIYTTQNIISLDIFGADNRILAFPTEEMRDAFYENFKNEIEQCKELL